MDSNNIRVKAYLQKCSVEIKHVGLKRVEDFHCFLLVYFKEFHVLNIVSYSLFELCGFLRN